MPLERRVHARGHRAGVLANGERRFQLQAQKAFTLRRGGDLVPPANRQLLRCLVGPTPGHGLRAAVETGPSRPGMRSHADLLFHHSFARYLFAAAIVAGTFVLRVWLIPFTGTGAPFVLFFAAVLVTSLFAGVGPGISALLISLPLAVYTFVTSAGYSLFQATFQALLFSVDGAVIVYLTFLMRKGRRAAQDASLQLRDATERITWSMARTHEVIELAPDAFFQADFDARFTDVNQAACRLLGCDRDELLGKTIFDVIPVGDADRLKRVRADLLVPGRVSRAEWTLKRKDGTFVPVEVSSNILPDGRWQGFVRDISQRKRIDHALQESEERFRLTIDEAPIGMALVALDGRFIRVNHALCEIVGYDSAELTGLTFGAITHPDDRDIDRAAAGQLVRGEIPRYQREKRYLRKDGTIVDVMLSASILRDRAGAPLYFISQIEDIRERKRAERALKESEAKFAGIVAIALDAVISIDDQQRIAIFNNGAEQIFGYTKEEAVGTPLETLIPERFRRAHRQHVERFASGDAIARRVRERGNPIVGLRKDGEEFPAEATISKLQVGEKTFLTVALRDITERSRIEKEQRFLTEASVVLSSSLDYEQTLASVARLAVQQIADWCAVDLIDEHGRLRRLNIASADPAKSALHAALDQVPLDQERSFMLRSVIEGGRPTVIEHVTPELL